MKEKTKKVFNMPLVRSAIKIKIYYKPLVKASKYSRSQSTNIIVLV